MEKTGLIFKQIPKVMASIGAIGKDRRNPQQGYQFRGIDDLYNACNAALAEHEVFAVPTVTDIKREERTTKAGGLLMYTILTVAYRFYASDGSNFECITIGEAMDSGDKGCNKAMSAAQKYAFLQVFSIPTEEPKDTEIETHEVIKKTPKSKPIQQNVKNLDADDPPSMLDIALSAFEGIDNIVHLGNHWKSHYQEYQASPDFKLIEEAKNKRKAQLLPPEQAA